MLSVVLQLNKGDYPENLRLVFCPNKQPSLEPFTCLELDLVSDFCYDAEVNVPKVEATHPLTFGEFQITALL